MRRDRGGVTPVDVLAIALGVLVGLSLGALGGGGSTLAVPILVFVGGLTATDATTASLLVVGVASAIGATRHFANGNVRLGIGLAFGAAGIVGARLGTQLNRSLDEDALLLAFSALVLFVAVRMYRSAAQQPADGRSDPVEHPDGGVERSIEPVATPSANNTAVAERVATPRCTRTDLTAAAIGRVALAATGVGALTGLFGVGGGFVVVPALTLLLGFGAKEAIGTSLVVIAVNATVALAMRWDSLDLDSSLVLPFLATVTAGVLAGSAVARRVAADRLVRSFAIMLAAVAVYTVVGTVLA